MPIRIEISYKTIIFTVAFLFLLRLLWQILDVILILFLAFILMSALRPSVQRLEKLHLPRVLAGLIIYLILIIFLGAMGGAIFPLLITQTLRFWEKIPELASRMFTFLPFNFEFITRQLTPVSGDILRVTIGLFSNIFTLITFLVFSFYLLLEWENLEKTFISFLGQDLGKKLVLILSRIEERLGAWVRGQLLLMFLIGLATYLGLLALGIDYALPLAITAGILEIVPYAGVILSGIPAVLVSLATSPALALAVIALYFIIHQSEGNLVVPTIMKKAVGLSPIITLLALMIGGKLAGIFGAILAVPTVVILQVILQEVISTKKA